MAFVKGVYQTQATSRVIRGRVGVTAGADEVIIGGIGVWLEYGVKGMVCISLFSLFTMPHSVMIS
ncbi:hypothetical protein HOLleu_17902 [Holothuria leucospilota]|uniref:Uncharacterized protein n=1 Tax=Holothuria leucospilota TaxID=206669 RepID=A0A9Q1H8N7_HOLLE|nr:hypothetical protein HOLleu_17902 [Holothuria leucospilota]